MKKYNEDDYIYDVIDMVGQDEIFNSEMEKINVYEHNIKSDKIKSKVKNQIKQNTFKKSSRFTKFRKSFIACAVLFLAVIGVGVGSEISNVDKFKNAETINEFGVDISKEAFEKYSVDVNEKVSSNGIDIMINSILLDSKNMWVKYYISSDKFDFSKDGDISSEVEGVIDFKLKLNNKDVFSTGGSLDKADNKTVEYIQYIDIDDVDLNLKEAVNVDFFTEKVGKYTGDWKINFNVKIKDISLETKEYKVGKTIILNQNIYRIQSVVIDPIQTTVYYKSFGRFNERVEMKVLNKNGKELGFMGASYSGRFFMGKGDWEFSSLNITGDELTIIPEVPVKNKSGELIKTLKGKEIKVNLNK